MMSEQVIHNATGLLHLFFLAQKLKQRSTHYDAYVGAQVHIMIIKLRKLHYTHVFQ